MRLFLIFVLGLVFFTGCSNVYNEEIPSDLERFEELKPKLGKLSDDERRLLAGYIIRKSFAMNLSGEEIDIPKGVTVGEAIKEQKSFVAELVEEEARQSLLREKNLSKEAEETKVRAKKISQMREAVSVALISKSIQQEYAGDYLMDENFVATFGYRNNTSKTISGVKGLITIIDLFGDDLSTFQISNDTTLKPGEYSTWSGSRSTKYSFGENQDEKLAGLDETKYKVIWEPETIVFEDGTTMEAQ